MSIPMIAIFAVQAGVFAYWAYVMFAALFRLNHVARDRRAQAGRGYVSGAGITIGTMVDFLAGRLDRPRRNHLFIITLALLILSVIAAILLPVL